MQSIRVNPDSVTRQFVKLLSDWPADDPALQLQCRLLLLDGIAVAVAGASEPGPGILAALARRECPEGRARVIGKGFSTGVVQAARVNGAAMHVLDFEPMWNPPNHALSPLLPALLALAESRERDGEPALGARMLQAIARGVEAQGRLRMSSGQFEPGKLTLHPPGIVGPLASALACAQFLGLDPDRTTAAVSMAASRSGAVLANVGSMTKALHCGDGAANGLECALLAAEGFTANEDAIGSPRGWGIAMFGQTFDPSHLTAPLRVARALDPGPSWKLFPSQFATHFVITAALAAREEIGASDLASCIRRVVLRTPVMPYIDRPRPVNGLDGKFSWQYTTAVALLDGRVDPESFADSRRFAPDAVTLLERIELVNDPSIPGRLDQMHVEVAVELDSGRTVTCRCDAPLGSWTRPVPPERIRQKARGLLEPVLGLDIAANIDRTILEVENFSVWSLMSFL
ncbi:MAG: MmgE/PrpD family protein [Burkholderiaceae bacterium]|nr:MmgE/PrpD family protein [Burkholderiaceae bacterium]